jgi:aspartate aminotransferase
LPGTGDAARTAFHEPQERFERLVAWAYRRFGPRLVDLSYANPREGPDEEVLAALRRALEERQELDFQYTPYGGKTTTRRLIASQLQRRFGLDFHYRDIVLTPGAMAALNVAFRALFDSSGEALVLTPCWLDYPLYLENLGIPFRFVPLAANKRLDLEAISGALSKRVRGVILSHPGCPSGVVLEPAELEGLAALLWEAEERFASRIYLIADEVHRELIWGGSPFQTALAIHPRTLSVYSFGKALFLQGQRIGYLAISPRAPEREELWEALPRTVRAMGFCTPTNLMQRAVLHLLDYRPALEVLAERQRRARGLLARLGFEVCEADATFFVYVKSPVEDEVVFAERLAEVGVLVLPYCLFHERGYFRLSLTAGDEALARGLQAFCGVLAQTG